MLKLDADELLAFVIQAFPAITRLGVSIQEVGNREIVLRFPMQARYLRPGGTVSGPTMMLFVDTAAFLLTLAHVGPKAQAVTAT